MKITLVAPTHTHKGAQYKAGDVLDVDSVTGKWLIDNKVGVIIAPKESSSEGIRKLVKVLGE